MMLAEAGAALAGLYFCPHRPEEGCDCRKPDTALLHQAARELGFEPRDAIVIGDKSSDIELGRRVGATTMLVAVPRRAMASRRSLTTWSRTSSRRRNHRPARWPGCGGAQPRHAAPDRMYV